MSDSDLSSDTNDSASSDEEGYSALDELDSPTCEVDAQASCPLCSETISGASDISDVLAHLKDKHDLDLAVLKTKHRMDQLSYIQFVNYLRTYKSERRDNDQTEVQFVKAIMACNCPEWTAEKYLQPVVEDDPLLSFWFGDDAVDTEGHSTEGVLETGDTRTTDLVGEFQTLEMRNQQLEGELATFKERFNQLIEQVSSMRTVMNRLIAEEDDKDTSATKAPEEPVYDRNYFQSYDDVQIHDVMISDLPRTEAYKFSILNNATDFKGKIVLDVGCGSGILSMFAAKAGAQKVYAVDQSNIIIQAMDIVRENGFLDKIDCLRGKVEDIPLPTKEVDIIISEFMGYFLLYEGMLQSYLEARDKFLRPGGLLFPNTAEMYLFGCCNEDLAGYFNRWEDVHGFTMSILKMKVFQPLVESVPEVNVVTNFAPVLQLDLKTCSYSDATFSSEFQLVASRDCKISAIAGYFDVGFTEGSSYTHTLTTSPLSPQTHWYQTVFPLRNVIDCSKGDQINGQIQCCPNANNPRAIDVVLLLDKQECRYSMT